MQRLEVSGAVRSIYGSLGVKWLISAVSNVTASRRKAWGGEGVEEAVEPALACRHGRTPLPPPFKVFSPNIIDSWGLGGRDYEYAPLNRQSTPYSKMFSGV